MKATTPNGLPLWGLDEQPRRLVSPVKWPDNVFLFRVWYDGVDKVKLDKEGGFVAHLPVNSKPRGKDLQTKVYNHVDDRGRNTISSPFISTSLSLPWVLANAHQICKSSATNGKPIKVSIIKASALDPEAIIVALDHLPNPPYELVHGRDPYPNRSKNREFADRSQEILVLNRIPVAAVLGTLEFEADLRSARELPWVTYDTSLFPGDWKHYTAQQYAEFWVCTFRDNLDSGTLRLDDHATNCLDLALRLLNISERSINSIAHTPAFELVKKSALNLSAYLYLWPFRELPSRPNTPPLPMVQVPSRSDAMRILRERWAVLLKKDGHSDILQSEGGHPQDESDELSSLIAQIDINGVT